MPYDKQEKPKILVNWLLEGVIIILIILFVIAAVAASTRPIPAPDYKTKLLLTYDGCKVYTFVDDGNTNYFARCPESVATTYQSGKATKNIITEEK